MRIRKTMLEAQKKVREVLKTPARKKLRKLLAKRMEIEASGKNTKTIDDEIAYLSQRMGNESSYGAANAWFTPLSTLRRAQRIGEIRRRRIKK